MPTDRRGTARPAGGLPAGHRRLFIGLRPPPAVRRLLLSVRHGVDGARWQRDEQLHLTLRFLGAVPMDRTAAVERALRELTGEPLHLSVSGVGRFGRHGSGGILWAGLAPSPRLQALRRNLDERLADIGHPPESRPFVPHLTLARLHRQDDTAAFVAANAGLSSPPFVISGVILFQSIPSPGGARYLPLVRQPLRPARR